MKIPASTIHKAYVLMLPRWYPNLENQANGNFIERHVNAISHNIPVQLIFVKGLDFDNFESRIITKSSPNLTTRAYYFKNKKGLFSPIVNTIRYIKIQFKAFKELKDECGNPVLCHVHVMARTSILACYLKLSQQIPFLISEHWSGYYPFSSGLSFFKKIFYARIFKYADSISAVSVSLGSELKKLSGKTEVNIVPNIVEEVFFGENNDINPEPNLKNIVHISNLNPYVKRVDEIISTFKRLLKKHPEIRLLIVGTGNELSSLTKMVQEDAELKGKVKMLGKQTPNDIADILQNAWTSVLYSRFETQSIVLLESIAKGIPVVAPDVGGIGEHCSNRGLLYEVNSIEAFENALDSMITSRKIFNPNELKAYAKDNFRSDKIGSEFYKLYAKLSAEI